MALQKNTTAGENVGIGQQALQCNVTGIHNTGIGAGALLKNTDCRNVAIGYHSLCNTSGESNTAIG